MSPPPDLPPFPSTIVEAPGVPPAPWRAELAERLEDHRRRRSRVQGTFDPSGTLDLSFGEAASGAPTDAVDADLDGSPGSPGDFDLALSSPAGHSPVEESVPLEKPVDAMRVLTSAAVEAGEATLVQPESDSEPERVEIILESSATSGRPFGANRAPESLNVAPLGARLMAGLADALILTLGGALFSLIFWVIGGHVSLNALNLGVFGGIATMFIVAYFGVFTALSSSTPGLLWVNLEVQSLEGGAPSPQESFWRAFGYLISMASLMLGFVWAAVDGDHMTWHDHMSGTFITPIRK